MDEIYQYPLCQHIGAASVPTVTAGATVRRGQCIAKRPPHKLGSNIFSSVDGIVKAVTEDAVAVVPEGKGKGFLPLQGRTYVELIEEAGIVGLGGAGFPAYAKFAHPFEKGGTVIINAAECEPILTHNIKRIEEQPEQVIRGLAIAMEAAHAEHGVIAIKKHHTKAIEGLLDRMGERMRIAALPDVYPMGEERAVIREVTGRLLSIDDLPMAAEAMVINAETACRIEEAVDRKKPFMDKDMTVGGKIFGNGGDSLIQTFLDVPLGLSVGAVFERAGGISPDCGELIMGGPFTGRRTTGDAPVLKTTGGLLAAECFPKGPDKIGLLVCACGAGEDRLREIAAACRSAVAAVEYCKQAHDVKGRLKCDNPGVCPGQVQKVMALKKAGAEGLLISSCTDCTNTVMSCAPQLGLPVYHCTDGALRAVNHKLIRKLHHS